MKIYSLSGEYHHFLGMEDGGGMINLTRAITFFETGKKEFYEPSVDVEELIWDERFNAAYLGEVMEFVEKHDLKTELAVDENFDIKVPILSLIHI